MNQEVQSKGKKFLLMRVIKGCLAVLVGALFLMAGQCPGGGSSENGEPAPIIVILEGVPPPIVPILPDETFDFGDVDWVGPGATQTFTITNVGEGVLNLTGTPLVDMTGDPEFSVSQQPPVDAIDPGNTTDFIITFVYDTTLGSKLATVTIESDDPDVPSYAFDVIGNLASGVC